MFTIRTEAFGRFTSYVLQNTGTGDRLQVVPEFGANVIGLWLVNDKEVVQVVKGAETAEELEADSVYKSAWLFPFPNRIRDGRYHFQGKEYQLPVNETARNNALHGFLQNKPFTVIATSTSETDAELTLEHVYEGDYTGYPFPFRVQLTLRLLLNKGFSCHVLAENSGATEMPFGCGWHPYFSLDEKIDNLLLHLPPAAGYEIDEQMIPTGKTKENTYTTPAALNDTFLDDCFVLTGSGYQDKTTLATPDGTKTLTLWQESDPGNFCYLQIFTPAHRNTICIEPVSCGIDAFNTNDGLLILPPAGKFSARFGVQLS